ncbi:pancreatic triacylglycerol lipase [Ixodes scapularis]
MPWPFLEKPRSRLHIDFAGSMKNRYLLIVVDAYSTWIEVVPVSTPSAEATIPSLRVIFGCRKLPDLDVSDNGPAFTINAGFTDHAGQLLLRRLGGSPTVTNKCMKSLGCFAYDDIFYHVIHRPINVLPDDRKQIATKFLLYTKRNPNEPELLIADDSNLNESFFDAASKSKVIVHGFMDSLDIGKWIGIMKDEFLKHSDYNVIVVDWSHGSRPPYTRATANTRVVGAELAHLIKALHNSTGVRPESFHVVGHSLGAQIAGYAGERLDKLGRITGLDPAGPYFFHMPPQVRLDPSDAAFVDVIHSDASLPFHLFTNLGIFNEKGTPLLSHSHFIAHSAVAALCQKRVSDRGFGIDQLVGHVDFYPNNGNKQPGCRRQHLESLVLEGMLESVRRLAACDHQRSVDFFTATINTRLCLPVGIACRTWEDFVAGRCGGCVSGRGRCAVMGFLADRMRRLPRNAEPVKLFLRTNPEPPYCLFQYQIIVKTTKSVPLWDLFGEVMLTLPGIGQKVAIRMSKRTNQAQCRSTAALNRDPPSRFEKAKWRPKAMDFF